MTITHLPPPSASGTASTPRGRRARRSGQPRLTDALAVDARQRRLELLLWAFRQGRPVDADALTLVALVRQRQGASLLSGWTPEQVRALLWIDLLDLCEELGLARPVGVATTLWTLFDWLSWQRGAGNAPLGALRAPLIEDGGLDAKGRLRRPGRPSRHPSLQ